MFGQPVDKNEPNKSSPGAQLLQNQAPSITLPKGGGAIRGMGEKFAANPSTGTGSMTIPIATSPARSGFTPQLTLSYDSGSGNGPFGFGWSLALPAITRRTDRGLPRYNDEDESDIFILSGAEDLVRELRHAGGGWAPVQFERVVAGKRYTVRRYRPRIEGLFARIERWTERETGETHWRSISRDNVTTLYGRTAESRIADPANPLHVFSWLICASYDDKGNAMLYEYRAEDSQGVDLRQAHERNRTPSSRSANRYLKRVRYGNRVSRLLEPDLERADWMFEIVFDYGEHDPVNPLPREQRAWAFRRDPFSAYRAGFEVRTYRLCRRVLVFHHFPGEEGVGSDCLVRSLDLGYRENSVASFIVSAEQRGYRRSAEGGYTRRSLPPVEFEYTLPIVDETVRSIDIASLENLPFGLDGRKYQWVDLDGEGLSGILTEQADAWYYKPNLGGGRFGPLETVAARPSLADLNGGWQQLLDLAGDGRLDLVALSGSTPGFYERSADRRWEDFRAFPSLPDIDWQDPNLRFVDLDGDGFADVLVTQDDVFTWYPSLAKDGFGPAQRTFKMLDEEEGPRQVFADREQSIYLADLSGDGLTDLVRIRNGEVCYWPNIGYGRFGARVTMDASPWFDLPDLFDQRRVRLADIDGSGTTDLIYLGGDGVYLYFNQVGNRWSEPRCLQHFPRIDNLASVQALDLLGSGTACLVWSSMLPGDASQPMYYIDLMGGQKPHLLVSSKNNLGAETRVQYVPSTRFYVEDKLAGHPWVTRLPFPVQLVERVETFDRVSGSRFISRYSYHHGYFDGPEREFRGFGRVDSLDTEEFAALSQEGAFPHGSNIDAASHVPPVLTKTWFHTGAYLDAARIAGHFAHEYYREPGLSTEQERAMLLEDTLLPAGLSIDEAREAARALKGSILRREIYALDHSEEAARPYSVSEQSYTIRPLQPFGPNRHAVFFTHTHESIDYQYERRLYRVDDQELADPRVSHSLVLSTDDFGDVLDSLSIRYGRRRPDPDPRLSALDHEKQARLLIVETISGYTNPVFEDDAYRSPLPCESRDFELLIAEPAASCPLVTNLFRFAEIERISQAAGDGRHDLPYEDVEGRGAVEPQPYRRLVDYTRTFYRKDDLSGPLPLGSLESLALPYDSHKLAFTPELVEQVYGHRVSEEMLAREGGYIHSPGDLGWWIPSGRVFYSPEPESSPVTELEQARRHFFLPRRYRDPFGQTVTVTYDLYDLLILAMRDALGNQVTAGERDQRGSITEHRLDYRVLQARLLMDANRNRSEVTFDTLGLVVGTAIMGKPEERLGDTLAEFAPDLAEEVIAEHLRDPLANPHAILGQASTRLVYDMFAYQRTQNDPQPQPAAVYMLARETHAADLAPGEQTRVQHSFSYSDGFGREIQKKKRVEDGPLTGGGPRISPRWVVSGWTIFNNKGKPVRLYEPFFSVTHHFEFARVVGVSSILFYDPVGRVVAVLNPNHTYQKVVFDPWQQVTWDVNDTVLFTDPRSDPDAGDFFRRLPEDDYAPTWYEQRRDGGLGASEEKAARKAARHARTPSLVCFDSLGRPFLSIAHNRFMQDGETREEMLQNRTELDIEGNSRQVSDALSRVVVRYDYNVLASRIHEYSMEAGQRWMLNDVNGKPLYTWDSRGHRLRTTYDALRRPTAVYLMEGESAERLVGRSVFGESSSDPEANNLRGKVIVLYDQAGMVRSTDYDFKGNPLRSMRQFARDYKATLDWSAEVVLEAETSSSATRFDALNRPTQLILPRSDRPGAAVNFIQLVYNEASILDQVHAWLEQSGEPEGRLDPATASLHAVTNIDYNAKGQRELIEYGNGTRTESAYDPLSFRLARLKTTRASDQAVLQDLSYTYDPSGNITHIQDQAQQTIYFRNRRVDPDADYTYDAVYRLVEATGREHLGQAGQPVPYSPDDAPRVALPQPGDGSAMGTYLERYLYDAAGNLLSMRHSGGDPASPGWTRTYTYEEHSLLEPATYSNRLSRTTVGEISEQYAYDAHGNMTQMAHLPLMAWDYRDELHATARQEVKNGGTPETTYYVYDATGQRIRKVTERQAGAGETPVIKAERRYLGGLEFYREYAYDGEMVELERETLHLMDGKHRIALVETRTQGEDLAPRRLVRFQYSNHIGSASLELDNDGQIISYEEYAPYGSTTYQSVRSQNETPKRYRYTGMERDEESLLNYHGARYCAPWLARWTSADPIGIKDGSNLYAYVQGNPVRKYDPSGTNDNDLEDFINEVLAKFDDPANQITVHGKPGTADIRMDIDEFFAVGERGISRPEALSRATDVGDRGFLDWLTNRRTKYMGTSTGSAPMSRLPVSVADDPNVLITRNFGEITEMQDIFNESYGKIRNPGSLSATALKNKINGNMREIIKTGTSESAVRVRTALETLGFEYEPNVGYVMKWKNTPSTQGARLGEELPFVQTTDEVSLETTEAASGELICRPNEPAPLPVENLGVPTSAPGISWGNLGMGALSAGGGVLMLMSRDKNDPAVIQGMTIAAGSSLAGGGTLQVVGTIGESAGLTEVGAIASEVGGILALPVMVYQDFKMSAEVNRMTQPIIQREIKKGNYGTAAAIELGTSGFTSAYGF